MLEVRALEIFHYYYYFIIIIILLIGCDLEECISCQEDYMTALYLFIYLFIYLRISRCKGGNCTRVRLPV